MSNKTHYRKVFKSDHLGVADLEDLLEEKHNLVFTVTHVIQELGAKVAGRKIDANIAYFKEPIKPLVLNAGNSKVMKELAGGSSFVEDWKNIPVQLYIDPSAKLKGEVVGGVRVHPDAPRMVKPVLTPKSNNWQSAIDRYRADGNFNAILERASLSEEHMQMIKEAAA